MPKLVKFHNGILSICGRVHAPGYSIRASDHQIGDALPDGWQLMPDDVSENDFVLPWVRPTGAHDAYPIGAIVMHSSNKWRSLIDANVWEPGVSGWAPLTESVPIWVQPTGGHDAYPKDALVQRAGKVWRSLIDANVWEPGVSGWRESAQTPPGIASALPNWVQPTGSHDAYPIGAEVMHNGKRWRSTVANNVWEPGVYGWVEF